MNSTFHTARCLIRPIQAEDIPSLLEMFKDKEVHQFIPPLVGISDEDYVNILKGKIASNIPSVGFWTVWTDEKELIGTVNLYWSKEFDLEHIGLLLKRQFWGEGYGVELMRELLKFGFSERKLPVIYAIINEGNDASKGLFTKLGFQLEKVVEEDNGLVNFFKLTKEQFV